MASTTLSPVLGGEGRVISQLERMLGTGVATPRSFRTVDEHFTIGSDHLGRYRWPRWFIIGVVFLSSIRMRFCNTLDLFGLYPWMPVLEPASELEAWIVACAPRALAYALNMIRDRTQAEDLVQDCFGRLLAKAADYDLLADGEKLLFKSVSNACLNWLQRKPPEVALEAGAPLETKEGPEQLAIRNELGRALDAALNDLPATQRAAIQLRSLGHSLFEVAAMLDISYANARVQVHRARAALAERLRPFLTEKPE